MPSSKDYQDRILADRYAQKDASAEVLVGDRVVVSLKRRFERDGEEIESRELGIVTKKNSDEGSPLFSVKLIDNTKQEDDWEIVQALERAALEVLTETCYEDICKRVSDGVVEKEPDNTVFKNSVYEAMVNREFVPAGRILAGLGCKNRTLTFFNCYVFPPPHDSREGIANHWGSLFNTFSLGGGVGWDNSSHRPRGEVVRKVNGRSSGAVSWAEQYSQITGAVEQGGSRRGASLQGLWCWHPDIVEFIQAKARREEFLVDGKKISRSKQLLQNSNVSVLISNSFMEAVEQNENWQLVFPDTNHPAYDKDWDGDLDKWREAGKPINVHKIVKARWLWQLIIDHAWAAGEPGLLFMERANQLSNSYYYNKLTCTNPCVTGDTPIFTDHGIFTVNELRNNTFYASQDKRLAEADAPTASNEAKAFFSTGVKPVYRLQTKEGYYLRCTADHRVITADGWKRANELEEGDLLHVHHSHHNFFGDEGSQELGYVTGWLIADGHITGEKAVLDFYDKKKELAKFFAEKTFEVVAGTENANRSYGVSPVYVEKRDKYTFSSDRLYRVLREYGITAENLKTLPTIVRRGTEQTQKAFLSALFTADGTFTDGGDKGASVQLDSTSPELLEGVQLLLLNFNIASKIYWNRREAGYRKLPDGRGNVQEYWCEAQHMLAIGKHNMVVFRDKIGFMLKYKQEALAAYLDHLTRGPYKETFTARFESLTPDAAEEVFDTTVHYTHAYGSGGLISHNCGEQLLPPYGVCNLGHINLAKFIHPDVEQMPKVQMPWERAKGMVNLDKLLAVVALGVRFLDNVTDLNTYHIKANEEQQMNERRIGIGILGYGELLVRLGLRYGSEDALQFTDWLFKWLAYGSYNASMMLAQERGPFPKFEASKYLESGFMTQLCSVHSQLKQDIRRYGVRNVTLNTIAPTGCVAADTLVSVNTGIKPIVSIGDAKGCRWQNINSIVCTDTTNKKATKFFINGKVAAREITTERGYKITASLQHRLRVIDVDGNYVWKHIGNLQQSDLLVLKRGSLLDARTRNAMLVKVGHQINSLSIKDPEVMTQELAEILGLYMGNGYLKDSGGIHIIISNKDIDVQERTKNLLKVLWGEHREVGKEQRAGCCVLNLNGRYIPRFFAKNKLAKPKGNYGNGSAGAFIPEAILDSGPNCVRAFLRGLFETDGSVCKSDVTLDSTSEKLVLQTQQALLALGIVSSVKCAKKSRNRFGTRPMFRLRVLNTREAGRFAAIVGFLGSRKQERLANIGKVCDRGDVVAHTALVNEFYEKSSGMPNAIRQRILQRLHTGKNKRRSLTQQFIRQTGEPHEQLRKTRAFQLVQMGTFLDPVASIKTKKCATYDLTVPNGNTYIANGFVSHNSVGTMLDTTTGIEPYFLAAWVARSRIGAADEEANILFEMKEKYGDEFPDYFVTTQDITPEEHVRTQAAAQKWIDASISKTINLPNDATRDDVAKAYKLMYELGCKGGTVYRDGSLDKQVLYYKEGEQGTAPEEKAVTVVVDEYKQQNGMAILRPKIDTGLSVTMSKETPVGRLHSTIRMHPKTGKPYDLFLVSGKGDISADVQALGRLISVILRMPDGEVVSQESRLEIIRDQLHRIPGRGQVGFGPDKVMSLPDGIAQVLHDYLSGNFPMANVPMGEDQVQDFLAQVDSGSDADHQQVTAWIMNEDREVFYGEETETDNLGFDFDICPKCGSATYVNIPGKCPHCVICMHTEC